MGFHVNGLWVRTTLDFFFQSLPFKLRRKVPISMWVWYQFNGQKKLSVSLDPQFHIGHFVILLSNTFSYQGLQSTLPEAVNPDMYIWSRTGLNNLGLNIISGGPAIFDLVCLPQETSKGKFIRGCSDGRPCLHAPSTGTIPSDIRRGAEI